MALATAGAAIAQEAAPAASEAVVERKARFKRAGSDVEHLGPTGQYYPMKAWKIGIEGSAVILCTAGARGALTDCALVSETPKAYGFGAAALAMAAEGWMSAIGAQAGERTQVTVPFALARHQ
jgi:TonB family protein